MSTLAAAAVLPAWVLARSTTAPGSGPHRHDRGERSAGGGLPDWLTLIAFVGGTLALGGLMGQLTQAEIDSWYRSLRTPPGTPPDWVFPVVWTPVYAAMGFAAWRVWRRDGFAGLHWWFAQLALNAMWTPAFFTMRSPALGLIVMLPFWLAIAATIRDFSRRDRLAAWVLVPYLVWVSYAAYLNAGFVWLN
jgi:benzodiazapine receptor